MTLPGQPAWLGLAWLGFDKYEMTIIAQPNITPFPLQIGNPYINPNHPL